MYPPVFPISSGQSVHGYNLLKHLSEFGHKIYSLKQKKNEFSTTVSPKLFDLYHSLKRSDVIYIRPSMKEYTKIERFVDWFFPSKKRIVEINAPLEEYRKSNPDMEITSSMLNVYRSKLSKADAISVVSNVLKDYLVTDHKIPKDKIHVITNGCYPEWYTDDKKGKSPLSTTNEVKIFWAGNPNLKWQSGSFIHNILKMFENNENIKFFIGGFNKIEEIYKNAIFLPKIDYNKLQYYLNDADILLVLYDNYNWSHIGFYGSSLKFFDYMASGKPVISPSMGQIAEIVKNGENGLLYDDFSEIKSLVEKLVNDKDLCKKLGNNGKKSVIPEYTWESQIRKTSEIIETI